VTAAVTRVKPLLAPAALHLLNQGLSAAGDGPALVVPDARRALVLAPHPDDETLGCGGTIALLTRSGTDVRVAFATDGGASVGGGLGRTALQATRRAEAQRACALLGTPPPSFLNFADSTLATEVDALAARLAELLALHRPELVFVPWALDAHHDHRALAAALARCDLRGVRQVWGYEVWAALPPNRVVDVSPTWSTKLAALAEHRSAAAVFDTDAFLALHRWRSVHALDGQGHAEAFLVLEPQAYRWTVELAAAARERATATRFA
jgi:LmbE family N-acetylglucosaminyl deacetylase